MALLKPSLVVGKEIYSCDDNNLEEGDQIVWKISVQNIGGMPADVVVCDEIPEWFSTDVTAVGSDGTTVTGNLIEIPATVDPGETYEVKVTTVAGPVDPCLTKTFTNCAQIKYQEGECVKTINALSDTVFLGCGEVKFDPTCQSLNPERLLRLMVDWEDEAAVAKLIDRYNNCDPNLFDIPTADVPPIEVIKALIIECLDKELLGKIIKG